MTIEEALELPAGPDLDAIVAEKVMGWKVTRHDEYILSHGERNHWIRHPDRHVGPLWSPSTNIAAAFEVLNASGMAWQIEGSPPSGRPRAPSMHTVSLGARGNFKFYCETLPLAICRSVLDEVWVD
jgi:hypothetical protein